METSVGAIIYSKQGEEEAKFLLLHYPGTKRDYWGFAKGHMEQGENETDTLRREIEEETGLKDLVIMPNFRKEIRYFFHLQDRTIFKKVIFYLVKVQEQKIQLSHEHIGYKWLSFKEALKQLSFYGPKKVLKRANKYLTK